MGACPPLSEGRYVSGEWPRAHTTAVTRGGGAEADLSFPPDPAFSGMEGETAEPLAWKSALAEGGEARAPPGLCV